MNENENKKYLDYQGLETLVGLIKDNFATQDDVSLVSTVATGAAEAVTALNTNKQDKLIAGSNITIAADGKTISATDTGEVNVIETVKVNGSALTPDANKAVNVVVPTQVSDLTDGANVVKDANYVHITVDSAISSSSSNPVENQAIYTALGNKLDSSLKGANSGLAELDSSGKVPSSQLPSYVDDVVEVADYSSLPQTGETGKIYITLDDNKTYRWSGSAYVEISATLALGETSSTAYRGDRGKTAYDHATDSSRLTSATNSGMYKVASTAEGHIASLTAMSGSDIEGLLTFATNNEVDALFASQSAGE